MAVQCSADIFVVNQTLVLRVNFVVRIATFAKPEKVIEHSMTTQTNAIKREFKTPLGVGCCGLICNGQGSAIETKKYENGSLEIFKTVGYKIEIVSLKIRVPLYNGDNLTDSFGLIFRIEKRP